MFRSLNRSLLAVFFAISILSLPPDLSFANVAGGGTGTGANVTVTQNGSNVVLSNGIVSFTIDTTNANITNFTYNGTNLLSGGSGGGHFYFDGSGGPTFNNPTYTLTVNPADNGGNQAEVWLQQTASPMDAAAYFDLLRGQQGFYDTLILTHQASYPDYAGAELRSNVYVGSMFNWLCVDPYRFREMASPSDTTVAVAGAPKEVMQWTSGIYNGLTECKYAYSAPLGQENVWGWASTTEPYGIWQTLPSHEYYDGGPMHRELTEHIGNTLLNMFGGWTLRFWLQRRPACRNFLLQDFWPGVRLCQQVRRFFQRSRFPEGSNALGGRSSPSGGGTSGLALYLVQSPAGGWHDRVGLSPGLCPGHGERHIRHQRHLQPQRFASEHVDRVGAG